MSISVGVLLMMGRMILAPLQALTSKLIKVALPPFLKAHQALEAADRLVDDAELAVHAASQAVAAADAEQDRATLELASALAGEGFSRVNPFKVFGAMAPSKLVNQGVLVESRTLTALGAAVIAHPSTGPESKRLAAKVERAADQMSKASTAHERCVQERSEAVKARNLTLPAQWRRAFANVKAAVRYADLVEGSEHYRTIFSDVNKAMQAAKKKKKAAPTSEPVS